MVSKNVVVSSVISANTVQGENSVIFNCGFVTTKMKDVVNLEVGGHLRN